MPTASHPSCTVLGSWSLGETQIPHRALHLFMFYISSYDIIEIKQVVMATILICNKNAPSQHYSWLLTQTTPHLVKNSQIKVTTSQGPDQNVKCYKLDSAVQNLEEITQPKHQTGHLSSTNSWPSPSHTGEALVLHNFNTLPLIHHLPTQAVTLQQNASPIIWRAWKGTLTHWSNNDSQNLEGTS